ncbi:MAG TPA: hypothetical protein VK837_02160 [Longimicrobiales bacterium]|nr:hypothetical protein [Longimicrobiales bacterium]
MTSAPARGRVALLLAVAAAAQAGSAAAQRPSARLGADSITVGDPVTLLLEVPAAEGETVRFPDSLALGGDVEFLGRASLDAADRVPGISAAAYRVTAWRPGDQELGSLALEVEGPRTTRRVRLDLPVLHVTSVLPEDTAGVEPRPPKGVLGPDRTLLPSLLLLALLLAVAIALGRWWARRRALARAQEPPAIPPATRALEELDRIRGAGLVARGEVKTFYVRTTRVLRDYLNAVEPEWGAGMTTAEIDANVDPGLRPVEKRELVTVLFQADRVKFARHSPATDEPEDLWQAVRDWIVAHEEVIEQRRAEAAAAARELAS